MGSHRAAPSRRHRPAAAPTPLAPTTVPSTAVPSTAVPSTAGHRHRKDQRVSRQQRLARSARRLASLPSLVGVVVLALAAAGALTLDDSGTPTRSYQLSAGVRALSGTDAVGLMSGPRERAISRDSERQALQDAAQSELKAAAEQDAAERNAALKSLGKAAEARAGEIAKNQWQLPTTGYHLTARFGMPGGLWSSNHTGLDFAAPSGTSIVAVANGVITETGYEGSYGNKTVETLADGTEIWYAHQSSTGVRVGQTVTAGQQIGAVGSTGNTTGPHLHLEVRPGGGDPVDPFQALVFHGVRP